MQKGCNDNDIYEIFQYLNDYNSFVSEEGALYSVATGMTASASCNPHEARKVREAILVQLGHNGVTNRSLFCLQKEGPNRKNGTETAGCG